MKTTPTTASPIIRPDAIARIDPRSPLLSPRAASPNAFVDTSALEAEASTPSLPPQVAAHLAQQLIGMQHSDLFYYYSAVASDGTISTRSDSIAEFNRLPADVARAIVLKLLRASSPETAYFGLRTLMALIQGSGDNPGFSAIFTPEIQSQIRSLAAQNADFFRQLSQVAVHNADGTTDLWVSGRMPYNAVHVGPATFGEGVSAALQYSGVQLMPDADARLLAAAIGRDPGAWGLSAGASSSEILEAARTRLTASRSMNGSLAGFAGALDDALAASSVSSTAGARPPGSTGARTAAAATARGSRSSATYSDVDADGHLKMTGDRIHDLGATTFNHLDADGKLSAFLNGTFDPEEYSGPGKELAMADLQQRLQTWSNFMKTLTNLLSMEHDIEKEIIQHYRA